ncbi:unnamed protein product [Cylindrotheca closterium]|uniref:Uncharacterized protein n=1 Tax=Cylindrotheca closterium TaxID=2856 RepID=A0AAD2FFF7_9STRA|nr:unnamed protein product [Cylindrotheca closterium]
MICNLLGCSMERFDTPWKPEKVFKKLEETGFLEQYLLLESIPTEYGDQFKEKILEYLLSCTAFIRKRFKKGTPCGDIVRTLMEGGDGHSSICQHALPYLQSLFQLSMSFQQRSNTSVEEACFCQWCEKEDSSDKLLKCSMQQGMPKSGLEAAEADVF